MSTITTMPVSMEGWQEEQQSWNQTSKFFVNMHKREDRVAQVVDFVAHYKNQGFIQQKEKQHLMQAVVLETMPWDQLVMG